MQHSSCSWYCCFFFSSRRRHTRFDCDWSSDVCSSDLRRPQPLSGSRPSTRAALPGKSWQGFAFLVESRERKITASAGARSRSEEHTSELQSQSNLVCRLLLEKKKKERLAEGLKEHPSP